MVSRELGDRTYRKCERCGDRYYIPEGFDHCEDCYAYLYADS